MDTQLELLEKARVVDLVLAAQDGDRAAFGQLFERYHRHVLSVALARLRNYAEAEELMQDVFAQAMVKLDQLRTPEAFGGWLRMITVRMAINRAVRRDPGRPAENETLETRWVEERTPLDDAISGEEEHDLQDGLARLGDLDRRTLQAFYVEGQSLIEMAARFDAPVGTIKRRLHVARKRLAKEVEPLLCA